MEHKTRQSWRGGGRRDPQTHSTLGSSGNCRLPKVSGRSRRMDEVAELTVSRREPGRGGLLLNEPIPRLSPLSPPKKKSHVACHSGALQSLSSLLSSSELSFLLGAVLAR